jgi:hypothetical protein
MIACVVPPHRAMILPLPLAATACECHILFE